MERDTAAGNAVGARAQSIFALMVLSNSTIVDNTVGVSNVSSASVFSRSNNTVIDNGTNVSGTVTPFNATFRAPR